MDASSPVLHRLLLPAVARNPTTSSASNTHQTPDFQRLLNVLLDQQEEGEEDDKQSETFASGHRPRTNTPKLTMGN